MVDVEKIEFSIGDIAPVIEEKVNSGGKVRFTVTGISMFPFLSNRRDQVTVGNADHIKKYDVVLHRRKDGDYILHRVIGIKNGTYIIAGDNETEKEYGVEKSQIIAKVVGFTRKGIEIDPGNPVYKLYSRVWVFVFPLRRIILEVLIRIRRLFCGKR